jgi:hypothetical protein
MYLRNLLFLAGLAPAVVASQQAAPTADSKTPIIQDNSFLVEEAYNQEQGIVQHISTFRRQRGSSDFEAAFTQEWPLGGITHQISYDLPLIRSHRETGIGDVRINYRYQLIGSGETRLAMAPRVSFTLPTGDWKAGRGRGGSRVEGLVPVSYVISPLFTTHVNAGVAVTPSARNTNGDRATSYAFALGHSLILTGHPNIHFLVETVYTREQEVVGKGSTEWTDDLVVSPGVRGAFNFASGLQIVPGVAIPIGVGPSHGQRGAFLYLSFEHPFARTAGN